MNFKKMKKRFFSLSRGNGGFTLVELIVVIAILAILGSVAVPAYSGYVEKANMGADQTLVGEVAHALSLYYYKNGGSGGGYVVLTADGTSADKAVGTPAMVAAFGEGWESLALKHDGWEGLDTDKVFADAYLASSYNGNEDALITQIGSVTNLLKDALAGSPNLVGSSFNKYLTDNGVDTTDNQAVSNAAVLYAADTIGKLDATKEAAVNNAFQTFYDRNAGSSYGNVTDLTLALKKELGTFGAVAAIYAHGEAFGQYVAANGNTDLLNNFHNINVESITDTDKALEQVSNKLGTMVYAAQTDAAINPFALQYIGNGQYAKDVTAYLESMKTVNKNADKFTDKLGSEGCYTDGTASAILQAAVSAGSTGSAGFTGCGAGEVFVVIDQDGSTVDSINGIQG